MIIPTEEQLAKINMYTPASMPPLEASEIAIISFISTDNLLNRSYGKWGAEELFTIASLLPGLPMLLDHDWDEVEKSQGLIFSAHTVKQSEAPKEVLDRAGNLENNQKIVKEEGYLYVHTDVIFPINSPVLTGLKFGYLNSVSLGGFAYKQLTCPLCQISFMDTNCPHYIPDGYMENEAPEKTAPYYIRSQVYDLGELSFVTIPNVPNAGIIRKNI